MLKSVQAINEVLWLSTGAGLKQDKLVWKENDENDCDKRFIFETIKNT